MNPLISPNWHVILIHYPLALIGLAILIELFSFLWRRSTIHIAARWMLLFGILSCIPAAATGLFAYRAVVYQAGSPLTDVNLGKTYHELKATPLGSAATDSKPVVWMFEHVKWEAIGTGILVFTLLIYVGASDRWRKLLYVPCFVLLLAGFTALVSGSWHAGEAIYQYGVGNVGPHEHKMDQTLFTSLNFKLQSHVFGAGWVVALGVAALAFSIRALHDGGSISDENWGEGAEYGVDSHNNPVAPIEIDPVTEHPIAHPHGAVHAHLSGPVTTSRWWLLLTVLALATAAGGIWILNLPKLDWPTLQNVLKAENRNLWHSILGSSIVVLSLLLALVTRVARRNTWVLSFFSLLMVVALASQVWLGMLLLYDTSKGPNPQFWMPNTTASATTAASSTATP